MKFLEKIGLGRKKRGLQSPMMGEKAQKELEGKVKRKNLIIKILISVFFVGVIIALYPRDVVRELSFQINEPWRQDDLNAPFDFSILKSDTELEAEIKSIRESTPPVFQVLPDIEERLQVRIDSIENRLRPLLEYYTTWQFSIENDAETTRQDSIRFRQELNNANLFFSGNSMQFLLNQYLETARNEQFGRDGRAPVLKESRNRLEHLLSEVLRDGILNVPRTEVESNEISVRNLRDRTERVINLANVRDLDEAREFVSFRLSRVLRNEPARVATEVFEVIIEPNFIFNEQQTEARINEAIANISRTKGAVASGQVIIRRGDLIDQNKLNMLRSLEAARASRASNLEIFLRYIGDFLIIFAFFLTFLTYLYLYRRKIFDENKQFGLVFLMLGLVICASAIIAGIDSISEYIVPLALAPILLTIFFDSRVGLLSAITISLIAAQINGYNYEFVAVSVVASFMGVYSVRDIRQRNQFFMTTPVLVFISYGIVLLGFTLARTGAWDSLGMNLVYVFVNILFISILTYPLIYLFEKLFTMTTDVTLYELNDNNNPILKSLMLRAAGSFQHSMQVANLTEAAASAIQANALLARVGALYHDIGKMEKPQYFVENQSPGANEHDKLTPSMSAKVIKDHVKAGIKIAEEENLPPIIVKFIETHHGNSIIKYFYDKAQKQSDKNKEIQEDFFRYDGPLPDTKETGILLLADCVEAASRSLSDPSYKKLETLVDRLVDERVAEGQLKNCPLTFRDLNLIKAAFLQILAAIYHTRIKYPGQDEKEKEQLASDEKKEKTEEKTAVKQATN